MPSEQGILDTKKFGERIRALRESRDLSQPELAKATGLSRDKIKSYESGTAYPRVPGLYALADYFEVSIEWLLTGEEGRFSLPTNDRGEGSFVLEDDDHFRPLNEYMLYLELITDPVLLKKFSPSQNELKQLFDAVHTGEVEDILDLIALLREIRKG